jgi:capsular exopolysaccharide synthesis family protein
MEELLKSLEMPRDRHRPRKRVGPVPVGSGYRASDKINYLRAQHVPLNKAVLRQNRVLTGHEPAVFRESYQLLRTQILQRLEEHHWKTLAVTSPCASEGRTLTAINLAISMAREIDYTVVLVDANLRQPVLLEYLGVPKRRGLGDYLTEDILIEELLIQPYYLEDLVVVPGGQAVENSAELLNSSKMTRLVSDLKSSTDKCIIIFDVPPVLGTAETLAFSAQVDAALLVIEDGITSRKDIARAADLLSNTNVVGTVLNKSGRVAP